MAKTITLPKNLSQKGSVVILNKEEFERLIREKAELRSAVKAILAGELALKRGKTRNFKEFLKSEFPKYAADL